MVCTRDRGALGVNTIESILVSSDIDLDIIVIDQSADDKLKKNPLKGYVCVQNHGGKIEFRNLWVREFKGMK